MNIRQAVPGDAHNLSALSILVFLHTYAQDGLRDKISKYVLATFTPEYFQSIFDSPNHCSYVVLAKKHLIGFVHIDTGSVCPVGKQYGYEVVSLYVHPFFQNKGVGKKLVEHIIRQQGNKFWLKTWIHNSKAIDFYHHLDLQLAGETYFDLSGEKHKNYIFIS